MEGLSTGKINCREDLGFKSFSDLLPTFCSAISNILVLLIKRILPHSATITPTCKVMSHVAQYLMVFLANLTTDVDSTPDCWANKHALCNNITCVEPAFNYSFFECEQPIGLSISIGSTPLESKPFYKSQPITLWGFVNSMLTLNTLSEDEVQFKVRISTVQVLDGSVRVVGPSQRHIGKAGE